MPATLLESPVQAAWAGVRLNASYNSTHDYYDRHRDSTHAVEFWRWTKDEKAIVSADNDGVIFAARQEDLFDLLDEKLGSPKGTTRVEMYTYTRSCRTYWQGKVHPEAGDYLVLDTPEFLSQYDDDTWCGLPEDVELSELTLEIKEGDVVRLSDHQCGLIRSENDYAKFHERVTRAGFVLRRGDKRPDADSGDTHCYLRYDPLQASRELARPYRSSKEIVRKPNDGVLGAIRNVLNGYLDEIVLPRVQADVCKRHEKRFAAEGSVDFKVTREEQYVSGGVMEAIPKLIELARRESRTRWGYLEAGLNSGYSRDGYCARILALEPVIRLYKRSKLHGEKPFGLWLEKEVVHIRRWQKLRTARLAREAARHAENAKTSLLYRNGAKQF